MRTRRVVTAMVVAAAAGLLSACASSSADGGSGKIDRGATLRLTYTPVQTLDPGLNTGSTAMISNTWPVYDRLLQISEDGRYVPMLATKWTFSPDGKALTLELRKGVTFSDGTPFDAAAVKANIERYQRLPASAGPTAVIASAQVLDTDHVVLHLTKPSRGVLTAISSAAPGIMVSPKALRSKDLGTHPVGTGAWVVDQFRPGQEVSYQRRPDAKGIWDQDTGKVARVDIKAQTTDAAYSALLSGQLDVALSNGDVSRLQSKIDSDDLVVRPLKNASTTAAFDMRQDLKPFDDVRVRQAVNYAIDRKQLVKALVPTTTARVQPLASVVNGFDPTLEGRYPYDPGKARALLKQAGYPHGVDAGTVYVANFEPFPNAGQIVQSDLGKVGIKIDVELYDVRQLVTQYSKSSRTGNMSFMAYPGIEPGSALAWFFDNPLTLPGGVSKSMAAQIQAIDDPSVSAAERAKRARAVVSEAMDQAYYAPLWQGVPGWVMSPKVHGVGPGNAFLAPLGGQDFRHAWMSK